MDDQKDLNQQPQDATQNTPDTETNGLAEELDQLDSMQADTVDPLDSPQETVELTEPEQIETTHPEFTLPATDESTTQSGNIQGEVTLDSNTLSEDLPEETPMNEELAELPELETTEDLAVNMEPEPLSTGMETPAEDTLEELPPLDTTDVSMEPEALSSDNLEPMPLEELPSEPEQNDNNDAAIVPPINVSNNTEITNEGGNRGRLFGLIAVVILLVIALLGVYWWFFLRDDGGTTSPTPSPTPTGTEQPTPTIGDDISTSDESHLECRFGLCVEVPGPGANVCSSSFDCEADSTITPTTTPEASDPTATPEQTQNTPTPTTTAVGTPDPTNTPTPSPTSAPTPTYTPTPSPTPLLTELPESGTTETTLLLILGLSIAGGLGFFLMRKSQAV